MYLSFFFSFWFANRSPLFCPVSSAKRHQCHNNPHICSCVPRMLNVSHTHIWHTHTHSHIWHTCLLSTCGALFWSGSPSNSTPSSGFCVGITPGFLGSVSPVLFWLDGHWGQADSTSRFLRRIFSSLWCELVCFIWLHLGRSHTLSHTHSPTHSPTHSHNSVL